MPAPVKMTLTGKPTYTVLSWTSVTSGSVVAAPRVESLTLDAAISETHAGENEITEHPVERGANIADHVRPKQDKLTIEGLISNTPLSRTQAQRTVDAFGVSFQTTAPPITGAPGYAEQAYSQLRALKDNGTIITIATALRTYANMVMESLSVPRDGKTGDVLRFTATFRQITLVENKMSKVVVSADPRAQGKVSKGNQVARTVDKAKNKEEYESVLSKGDGLLGSPIRSFFGVN